MGRSGVEVGVLPPPPQDDKKINKSRPEISSKKLMNLHNQFYSAVAD